MKPLIASLSICIAAVFIAGCSSLSFTRGEKPFDGTVHATSSLLCAGYWSNHGFNGQEKHRSVVQRIIPTSGLVVYSAVDLVSSLLTDIVLYPVHARGGGPVVATFDRTPHAVLPCGTIENSINVVGGL